MCCYAYFLFTDFVPDPLIRKEIGNYLLFFTAVNVVINLFLIARRVISGIQHKKKVDRRKKQMKEYKNARKYAAHAKSMDEARRIQKELLDKRLMELDHERALNHLFFGTPLEPPVEPSAPLKIKEQKRRLRKD
jgi:uncharacterized membrane protein (DUF106 family)